MSFVATPTGSLVVLAIVGMSLVDAQATARQGRQNKNTRPRQKGKADQCHGKEIDKCYEQLQSFSKADRPADILKTKDGVDKLCNTFNTVVECQKGYIKKCATPLQKELFDFFLESFTKTVEEFCGNNESKQSKFSSLINCRYGLHCGCIAN